MRTHNKPISFFIKSFVFLIIIEFLANTIAQGQKSSDLQLNKIPKLLLITSSGNQAGTLEEKNDYKSLKNSLDIAGFAIEEMDAANANLKILAGFDVIVLPYLSARNLTDRETEAISQAVKSGVNLVFDCPGKLAELLGIKHVANSITVSKVRDLKYSKSRLYWTFHCTLRPIDFSSKTQTVLCIDDTTKLPLAVSGSFGKGNYIYFGTFFDPITDKGYTRFPFLVESIYNTFGLKPIVERQAVEMYFDPGNRSNDTLSADDLAKLWRKNKVKRIFAAGWYYDTDYDYTALIRACHENGILVLCWFETPMISTKFWEKHPEWREKTVFQRDAHIDWRYLMNLADTNCRKQVFKEFEEFLMKHDWDGLDFAELYFEPSPVGPELPENFTPMNSIVREEYKKIGGFDPLLLFDTQSTHYWKTNTTDWKKYAAYRKDLLFRLKKHFLDFFTTIKNRKKDFEVMLTVLDVSITPELSEYIGEDTQNSLTLYKSYDITLQEEDPSNCWGLTPERYDKMGQLYRKDVIGNSRLLFDCNVVSAHELGYGGFPSEVPTGEELRQIVYNMELHDVRPVFYSEDVVSDIDYKNISTVLAHKTKVNALSKTQWKVQSPKTVFINTGNSDLAVNLDGNNWFGGEGEMVLVPQGKHLISFSKLANDNNALRLKNITSELFSAKFTDNAMEFIYNEEITSCYVIINKKPSEVYIDKKLANVQVFSNDNDEYVLKLPLGKHSIKIISANR